MQYYKRGKQTDPRLRSTRPQQIKRLKQRGRVTYVPRPYSIGSGPLMEGHRLLICSFLLSSSLLLLTCRAAETHYHDFVVQETAVKRLCRTRRIITVNGMFPGPTLEVRNGDTLVVNVVNRARYNVTVHWHGVRQTRTAWADGPEFVTQCPVRPGGSYTYRFTVEGQEGTLWWHAHSSWLRATVYGALLIRPRENATYPFGKPKRDFPILLGEWWNKNPVDVVMQAARTGAAPDISDAYTINSQPGDLYRCSSEETTVFPVAWGDTVLLRVINAALNTELFFSVAGHTMTVVGADASYTKPFPTPVLMLGPGQTTDVILIANQFPARYYMAARAYASAPGVAFDNTTTTAILEYKGSGCAPPEGAGLVRPPLPLLPAFNDTPAATAFAAGIRSPGPVKVPDPVDVELFFTVGLGVTPCPPGRTCGGPNGARFAASVNNVSFVLPDTISILQAHRLGLPGVFSTDFPAVPPVQFDYTGGANVSQALWTPSPGTKLLKLRYGEKVQLVLQGTSIVTAENHPIHIHGYNFYVLAEGFGNFDDPTTSVGPAGFNMVDPPMRNTVAVPVNGWAVVRFVADNPGVWLMHCHLDAHLNWGLAMAFVVEDGVEELQSLEPPPVDLPIC